MRSAVQLSVRVAPEIRKELKKIARFERARTPSDLLRTWIRLQVNSYRGNRAYLAWEAREMAEAKVQA